MNYLNYHFECLDGKCSFICEFDEELDLIVESTIPEIENKHIYIEERDTEKFIEELKKAEIEKWYRHYRNNGNGIEDAARWKVEYRTDQDKLFKSSGEESFEPYNYNHLIRALMIADKQAEYFLIGEVNE